MRFSLCSYKNSFKTFHSFLSSLLNPPPPTSGMSWDFWWTDWAEVFRACWLRAEKIVTNFSPTQSFLFGRKTTSSNEIERVPWGRFLVRCSRLESHETISLTLSFLLNFVSLIFRTHRKIIHAKKAPILNSIKYRKTSMSISSVFHRLLNKKRMS